MLFASDTTSANNALLLVLFLGLAVVVVLGILCWSQSAELTMLKRANADREEDSRILYEVNNQLSMIRYNSNHAEQNSVPLDPNDHTGSFPSTWHYVWRSEDRTYTVEVRYESDELSATMVMTMGDTSLKTWKYGPGHDPITELPDDVRQNMGLTVRTPEPVA